MGGNSFKGSSAIFIGLPMGRKKSEEHLVLGKKDGVNTAWDAGRY
jgi:hypothetical protein